MFPVFPCLSVFPAWQMTWWLSLAVVCRCFSVKLQLMCCFLASSVFAVSYSWFNVLCFTIHVGYSSFKIIVNCNLAPKIVAVPFISVSVTGLVSVLLILLSGRTFRVEKSFLVELIQNLSFVKQQCVFLQVLVKLQLLLWKKLSFIHTELSSGWSMFFLCVSFLLWSHRSCFWGGELVGGGKGTCCSLDSYNLKFIWKLLNVWLILANISVLSTKQVSFSAFKICWKSSLLQITA